VAGCAGQWIGSYTGDDAGTLTLTLAESGALSGTSRSAFAVVELTGQVSEDGTVTGTGEAEGETGTFDGRADLNACTMTGDWNSPASETPGTWNAQRS
jgi:hypothetical protein